MSRGAIRSAREASVGTELRPDGELDAAELVEVITHCAGVAANAMYRMMVAASLIHDERAEEYALARAVDSGEMASVAAFDELATETAAGADRWARFGPDGYEQAVAEVGAALTITAAQAKTMIAAGDALRYRLRFTGHGLACGRIDRRRFEIVMARTALIDDVEVMETVDAHVAEAVFARGPMSTTRFTAMVDAIVARWAPSQMQQRRRRAEADRHVTVAPDRFHPGRSRITGSLPIGDAAAFDAQLTTIANTVCAGDGRTIAQRRADALLALANGWSGLVCRCEDCVTTTEVGDSTDTDSTDPDSTDTVDPHSAGTECIGGVDDEDASTASTDGDGASTTSGVVAPDAGCACDRAGVGSTRPSAPRPTFHIVVNLSTLLEVDEHPGFLDRHGIIDAETARMLLTEARRTYVLAQSPRASGSPPDSVADDPPPSHTSPLPTSPPNSTGYVPSRRLRALVCAGELCCAFPGCNSPVWQVDVDHTNPYDHRDPRRGGATAIENLKPLCRFHHRIKTFTAWQGFQDDYLSAWFTAPGGHMFLGNAYDGRDLFGSSTPSRDPDHPARRDLERLRADARAREHRARDRWDDANPPPF